MKSYRQKIFIVFTVLFVFIFSGVVIVAKNSTGNNLPELFQTGDEKFDKTFREGRELIDKEDWKQAAEKFKAIVCDCPEKKYVDAAFYWLAFTYKKQKMYTEMNAALDRLQKNFPNSSWADDARVMRIEQNVFVATAPSGNFTYSNQLFGYAIATTSPEKTPLDREEEVKLAAFRSLLSTDAGRAVQLSDDILKSDSKASENLKIQIIRILTFQRLANAYTYTLSPAQIATNGIGIVTTSSSGQSATTNIRSGQNNLLTTSLTDESNSLSKFIPQIRDILVKNFKANTNAKVKKEIIYALGRLNDGESTNYLSQFYDSESDKELKKAVLQSFGSASLYFNPASAKTTDLRKSTINKLLEIAKNDRDIELKTAALSSLQMIFFRSRAEEKIELVQALLQTYDSTDNENFKSFVIRSLAQSNQDAAVKKLMDIAKNDKSDNLRIAAINALRGNKNPEVARFLEDLIK